MVRIAYPPPDRPPAPLLATVPAGTSFVRLFDSTRHGSGPTTFRRFGPLHRFDHQELRGTEPRPAESASRGIYYAGFTLSCCIVETFGDAGAIEWGGHQVARPVLTRDLRVLDLRGPGAMRAGSVAALAKTAERACSQAWGRYVYEHPELYGMVDGLRFFNAHNDEDALALFERAEDSLHCDPDARAPLSNPAFRPLVMNIARAHNLLVVD